MTAPAPYHLKVTVVEDGTRSELEFERQVVRMGRAIDNDIRLSSQLASRHHCRIELDQGAAWAVDLGSSNGTRLNGEGISRALLRPGDELELGGSLIRVVEGPVPPAEEPSSDAGDSARHGDTQSFDAEAVRRALGGDAATTFGSVGLATLTGEAQRERENLRVFAHITAALLRETEPAPLLRLIVDSAVALAGGERGFLLLSAATAGGGERGRPADAGRMNVRVARHFDRTDVPVPSSRLSMGIAHQVIEGGRPVLSVDAGHDERFQSMASVEDLKLRSVLCVPIRIEEDVEGVLYVDNRLQRGAFSEDDLDLVELLAGQAAIAIRNARLLAELRERNRRLDHSRTQIEALNDQLGRKVRDRDTELAVVRAELERERGRYDYTSIVGASEGMRQVFAMLDRIIETELPVLIHGASGTGKELIARAIHYNGARSARPFVSVNCAALPDSLLESELFGHTRGAFTGADRSKKGLIEQATGGTLFLDEIGDMSPEMQKKLLRVLQEGEVRPLGSNKTVQVDIRLVAASHGDLQEMVKQGAFREDLFYRINVLGVQLPPLRERREDIPLLAETLLARAARETGREVPVISSEALAALVDHEWPGNVRELENEMRRLVVLAEGVVTRDQLSANVLAGGEDAGSRGAGSAAPPEVDGDLREAVARFERTAIEAALAGTEGNKSRAASDLGISRFALQRKLEKYGLAEGGKDDEPGDDDDGDDQTGNGNDEGEEDRDG